MNKIISRSLITVLCLLSVIKINGQCTFGNNGSNNGVGVTSAFSAGQSFETECTGNITSITLNVIGILVGGNATLKFYRGLPPFNDANVVNTQTIKVNTTGLMTVNLATPIPVKEGQQFTFDITTNADFALAYSNAGNPYPNGQPFTNGIGAGFITQDFFFLVDIIVPPIPVPTISQWGLLIFGLLIINLSLIFIKRRELI